MEPNSAQQTPARQVEEQTGRDTSPPEEHRSRQARRAAERAAEKAVQKLDKKPAATDDDDNNNNINLAPQEFPGEIYIREASAAIRDAQLAGQANPPQDDDAAHSTTISFFADGSRDSARNGKGAACAVVWRDPAAAAAAAAAAATADDNNNNNNNWRVDAEALPDGANSHDAEAHACLRALQLAVATTRRPSSSSSSASPVTVRLIQIFTDSATVLQALIKLRSCDGPIPPARIDRRRLARWTARRPYFLEQLEAIYNWAALLKDEGVRVVFRWVKGHAWQCGSWATRRADEAARAALPSRRPGWVAPEPEWWMRRMERERERKKRERERREEWAEEEARLEAGAPKRRKLGR